MSVGEMIVLIRNNLGITQTELAKKANISRSVMNRIELGTRPLRDDELKTIAKILNVSTDYLLGIESPKTDAIKLTNRDQGNLDKLLQQAEVTFDSDTYKLTDDDRTKIRSALELAFFDAKKRNKRKK